jgi:hypothetical protein
MRVFGTGSTCAFSVDSALLAAWDPNDGSDKTTRLLQLSSGEVHELPGCSYSTYTARSLR